MLNRTNVVLAVALGIVTTLALTSRVDYSRPNVEILPDMKYTPAWTTYSPNPVFPNGRTLQAPVSGTIARGQMPLHFEATKEEAVRAGDELSNPYAPGESAESAAESRASIERGAETFRVYCVCCHGATGLGDGPVATRGFPPPPSLLTGKSRQMKDGQLFHVLTYGQASMPDFSAQLSPVRRWDAINYIRSLQANADAQSTAQPTVVPEEPKKDSDPTNADPTNADPTDADPTDADSTNADPTDADSTDEPKPSGAPNLDNELKRESP